MCTMRRIFLATTICNFLLIANAGKQEQTFWNKIAQDTLKKALSLELNTNIAKNVILFVGDGLGIPTITASRIYKGQLAGRTGEEEILNFEKFPHVALIKTYNVDNQVPDSAGTATAFLCGVKSNYGAIGVDESVNGTCATLTEENKLPSIGKWSYDKGKAVGVVTTTRVTHATPASLYAHSPDRDWEMNAEVPEADKACDDIAKQLIYDARYLKVILGGGRGKFLTVNDTDPEGRGKGQRTDENLINTWINKHAEENNKAKYVWNLTEFANTSPTNTDYLLGLFEYSHMKYDFERTNDTAGEPSLSDMVKKAIEILRKDDDGFFLLAEGGRIDHGHHDAKPKKAFQDTVAFDAAVQVAFDMTSRDDTLIVVTADHSHVMNIGGYPGRGNPIMGLQDNDKQVALDGMPYTTIQYANSRQAGRVNLTGVNTDDWEFIPHGLFAVGDETHGGEDIATFAVGPMAHLFHGVHEQNYITHVLAYASCVGPNLGHCSGGKPTTKPPPNTAVMLSYSVITEFIVILLSAMVVTKGF